MMHSKSHSYIYTLIFTLFYFVGWTQPFYLEIQSNPISMQDEINRVYQKKSFISIAKLRDAYLEVSKELQANGFIYLQLEDLVKTNDSSYIGTFLLGEKYDKLVIKMSHIDADTRRLLDLPSDSLVLSIQNVQPFIDQMLKVLDSHGHPISSIGFTDRKIANQKIIATLEIQKDIKRTIDNLYITPYEKFPKGIKKQLVKRYQHKDYSQQTIQELQQEMQQFPFVKIAKPAEILFTDEQTILYVYAEKSNASRFDGLIGFNSNEETGKLQFNGHIDLQLLNVFDVGEQLKLYWKNDGQQQSTLRIQTEVPYLLSSPFGVLGELQIFKQDSTMQNTKMNLQALYYFTLQNRVGIGIQNTSSTAGSENTFGAENFSNTYYTASHYYHIYQDHFLFPIFFSSSLQMGYGKRKTDSETLPQYFIQFHAEKLWQINPRNYIHHSAEAYFLHSDRYIYNELYRFGGIHSIRGFAENSLLAKTQAGLYNEVRYLLAPNMYLHSITDVAYYESEDTNDFLYSFGLGFGIQTGGGLFNIIYANGVQPNTDFK